MAGSYTSTSEDVFVERDASGAIVQIRNSPGINPLSSQLKFRGNLDPVTATVSVNATYTIAVQWIGQGPAPSKVVLKLTSNASRTTSAHQTSGTLNTGLFRETTVQVGNSIWKEGTEYRVISVSNGTGTTSFSANASVTVDYVHGVPGGLVNYMAALSYDAEVADKAVGIFADCEPTYYKPEPMTGLTGPQLVQNPNLEERWVHTAFQLSAGGMGHLDETLTAKLFGLWSVDTALNWNPGGLVGLLTDPGYPLSALSVSTLVSSEALQNLRKSAIPRYYTVTVQTSEEYPIVPGDREATLKLRVDPPARLMGQVERLKVLSAWEPVGTLTARLTAPGQMGVIQLTFTTTFASYFEVYRGGTMGMQFGVADFLNVGVTGDFGLNIGQSVGEEVGLTTNVAIGPSQSSYDLWGVKTRRYRVEVERVYDFFGRPGYAGTDSEFVYPSKILVEAEGYRIGAM